MKLKQRFVLGLLILMSAGCSTLAPKTADREVASTDHVKETYPTVKMSDGKLEGDRKKGVIYWDAKKREQSRVIIRDGRIYDQSGHLIPDTRSSRDNHNNYVMDADGNFYLFDEYTYPLIRHSSIFAGGEVAGAGDLVIVAGQIVYIDSNSGHYKSKPLFENVLKRLNQLGVPTTGCLGRQAIECRPGGSESK